MQILDAAGEELMNEQPRNSEVSGKQTVHSTSVSGRSAGAYESPSLVLVGNLRNLRGGTGRGRDFAIDPRGGARPPVGRL